MPRHSAAAGEDGAPTSVSGFRYLGAEAFVFGFPLLTMAARMRQATDVAGRSDGAPGKRIEGQAPPNQFAHLDRFPDPTLTAVVAANANTLYSLAWLDLADEPILLELPPTGGRSYLLPLVDAWTNVLACLGPRTNGQAGGVYAFAGPGWEGDLPSGVHRIDSATNTIWAISHIHSFDGKEDLAADLSIQRHLRLSPLSAFGGATAPPERIAGAAPEFDR
ncbi:MAG TPA: DUF1254 domain-containing protein, partial [Solirubrobacterales bacterium]|nr:DUF1254 domain-containing protein [Solirubrobacterales bacterium]